MRMAFTVDDLPIYPHLASKKAIRPYTVATKIMKASSSSRTSPAPIGQPSR